MEELNNQADISASEDEVHVLTKTFTATMLHMKLCFCIYDILSLKPSQNDFLKWVPYKLMWDTKIKIISSKTKDKSKYGFDLSIQKVRWKYKTNCFIKKLEKINNCPGFSKVTNFVVLHYFSMTPFLL